MNWMTRGKFSPRVYRPAVEMLIISSNRTLEYAAVEDAFCPQLHRINQLVRHRAIYADQAIPHIPPILTKYAQPNRDLVETAKSRLEDLIETAEVKKGVPISSLLRCTF
jgi:hypothetical protein